MRLEGDQSNVVGFESVFEVLGYGLHPPAVDHRLSYAFAEAKYV